MNARYIVLLVIALILLFVAVLFTVQNGGRFSGLSLSFGFAGGAFQLKDEVPVPWLMWSSLGAGLLLGGGWGLWQRISSGQKIREMQRKLARASVGGSNDSWKS